VSPRGSSVILHQSTQELLDLREQGAAAYAPFPPDLVATWRSGFPAATDRPALAALLSAAGWPQLEEVTSRARIAAQLCSSRGMMGQAASAGAAELGGLSSVEEVAPVVDFEATPDEGRDRWAVFVTARK
jgi:hypothetical protein